MLLSSTVLACLLAAPAALPDPAVHKLLVLPLDSRQGVPRQEILALSDFMVAEARRIPGFQVIAQEDLEKMLSLEVRRQLVGCDATSCLAEIGGALNADEVLYGSVGRLGRADLVLSLTRINPRTSAAVAGQAERITRTNADAMLDGIPRALKALYPDYQPPEPRVRPMNRLALASLLALSGTALQYASFASMFASVIFIPCPLLGALSLGTSGVACLAAPLYVSALQAWLADLVGRRQAGFRWAALAGMGSLLLAGAHTLGAVLFGALLGLGVGALLQLALPNERKQVDRVLQVFFVLPKQLGLSGAILGAGMGLWVGVALLVLAVPAIQAAAILGLSRARSADEDAARPALYAPYETPPAMLTILPCWLVGGQREAARAVESVSEPEVTPAPAAAPVAPVEAAPVAPVEAAPVAPEEGSDAEDDPEPAAH